LLRFPFRRSGIGFCRIASHSIYGALQQKFDNHMVFRSPLPQKMHSFQCITAAFVRNKKARPLGAIYRRRYSP
jgi:hypothetical protein